MKVLILNHSVENCGVYQYGKRFGNIATKSKKHDISYVEINSHDDLVNITNKNFDIILYNHLTGTMPWVNDAFVEHHRSKNTKQGCIVHNVAYSTFFDFFIHQDPNYIESPNNFSIPRPLLEYVNNIYKKKEVLQIGSFGFGFRSKLYPEICKIVNDQIDIPVKINLHLTMSHFCNNNRDMIQIDRACKSYITKSNIELKITTDFKTDTEMLDFLAINDVNMFLYQQYAGYNGISSVIDYALSVKRPIVINNSNMFNHINQTKPSIIVGERSILDIANSSFEPLEQYLTSWSNNNLISKLESIIEQV